MFENYEYLKRIAYHQNLSVAAEELYVSQPALSKYLNRLEEKIGVCLVDRTTKPLRVTEAGKIFLSYVEEYEQLLRSLTVEMSRFSQHQYHFSIGITTWRGTTILPKVYSSFKASHPQYDLEFREAVGDTLLKLLDDRRIDFCLMNISYQTDAKNFEWLLLDEEEIRLVMRKDHPFLARFPEYANPDTAVDLEKVQNESFILLLPTQQLTQSVDKMLREQRIHLGSQLRLSSMNTALGIAAKSEFMTFYPHSLKMDNSLDQNLTTRKIKAPVSRIPFSLVLRRGQIIAPALIPILDFFFHMYNVPREIADSLLRRN